MISLHLVTHLFLLFWRLPDGWCGFRILSESLRAISHTFLFYLSSHALLNPAFYCIQLLCRKFHLVAIPHFIRYLPWIITFSIILEINLVLSPSQFELEVELYHFLLSSLLVFLGLHG